MLVVFGYSWHNTNLFIILYTHNKLWTCCSQNKKLEQFVRQTLPIAKPAPAKRELFENNQKRTEFLVKITHRTHWPQELENFTGSLRAKCDERKMFPFYDAIKSLMYTETNRKFVFRKQILSLVYGCLLKAVRSFSYTFSVYICLC
jgi:hypothetical protein